MNLRFISDENHQLYKSAYVALWNSEGNRIVEAFEAITGLDFVEDDIIARVGPGDEQGDNYSGARVGEPMLFRYSIRDKLGTMMHELGHRLIMQHQLFPISNEAFGLYDLHQVLDLFLFDVMEMVYGREAALYRVAYECSFPDMRYARCWEEAFAITKEERSRRLGRIVNFSKGDKSGIELIALQNQQR